MKFKRYTNRLRGTTLNLTPLIDVMFLLIIFFILSSSFVLHPGIPIHLPQATSSEALKDHEMIITITKYQKMYIDDRLVSLSEVKKQLHKLSPRVVIIQSDGAVPLEKIVTVWDTCRTVGVKTVHIATKQETVK